MLLIGRISYEVSSDDCSAFVTALRHHVDGFRSNFITAVKHEMRRRGVFSNIHMYGEIVLKVLRFVLDD